MKDGGFLTYEFFVKISRFLLKFSRFRIIIFPTDERSRRDRYGRKFRFRHVAAIGYSYPLNKG